MRVLLDHPSPFVLAHGGVQIQIEQTKAALERIGVAAEYLRWWDCEQRGDLIHFFGTPQQMYLSQARLQKLPVIATSYFSETCNRSNNQLRCQAWLIRAAQALPLGRGVKDQLKWGIYRQCSQNIVGLEAESRVLQDVYRVPAHLISVVPLGLSEQFLHANTAARNESHLICTGTIRSLKYSVELAEMARTAQTPILFVGKPYHEGESYWLRFKALIDNRWVKYHPHIESEAEMVRLLQGARGFVLMSDYENWSLSAHEAAACGLPLLVQDQKWSRERFGDQAHYFAHIGHSARNTAILREFYEMAPGLPNPKIKIYSWADAARELRVAYDRALSTSR